VHNNKINKQQMSFIYHSTK